MDPRISFK
jgi:hypothetical protein